MCEARFVSLGCKPNAVPGSNSSGAAVFHQLKGSGTVVATGSSTKTTTPRAFRFPVPFGVREARGPGSEGSGEFRSDRRRSARHPSPHPGVSENHFEVRSQRGKLMETLFNHVLVPVDFTDKNRAAIAVAPTTCTSK